MAFKVLCIHVSLKENLKVVGLLCIIRIDIMTIFNLKIVCLYNVWIWPFRRGEYSVSLMFEDNYKNMKIFIDLLKEKKSAEMSIPSQTAYDWNLLTVDNNWHLICLVFRLFDDQPKVWNIGISKITLCVMLYDLLN